MAHRAERGREVLHRVLAGILAGEANRQKRDSLAGAILRCFKAPAAECVRDEVVVLATGGPAPTLGPLRAYGVSDDLCRDQVPGCSTVSAGIEATR